MQTIDYKSQLRKLYRAATTEVELVDVPPMNFVLIQGQGDPASSPDYPEAVEAVFSVANALKLLIKKTEAIDYSIMPLEALWWADEMSRFSVERKAEWK